MLSLYVDAHLLWYIYCGTSTVAHLLWHICCGTSAVAHLLWHMRTFPKICPSKAEIVYPKMLMLEHMSIHHLLLTSNTVCIHTYIHTYICMYLV